MNIPRKRSGSNSKRTKEKFEILFKEENCDETTSAQLDEIISAMINVESFEIDVMKIVNIEQSPIVRRNLAALFSHCLHGINLGEFESTSWNR